ncbi:MAG TPA: peptidyl-prolyl cis-trans isomerase [Desulfobacteraceae bacterium]|nr:peptidyl-prolyl cis-trans isomerase [Desulfobacteraceae bacterium]HPJ67754.1 peptidyl-prolyl cis-trans isomerase [Desulfobacteraceae bacterium]HPQ28096.1 peptidyl-prolyl cis-trans isomerase [Desulfobacteraceae bacterium]
MKKRTSLIMCLAFILQAIPVLCLAGQESRVLATVGSEKIDETCINSMIDEMPSSVRGRYANEALIPKLLEKAIEIKVFAHGAREVKLEEKPEVMLRIKNSIDRILASEYLAYLEKNARVEESEILKYYEDNRRDYFLPERVKLWHISVRSEEDAKKVIADLKGGADFSEIARERSVYQPKTKPGDIGWVKKGMLHPDIEEVAFKIKTGIISDIIPTKDEYHVIMVEDRKDAETIPLSDVRESIESVLLEQKKKDAVDSARKDLKEKLHVRNLYLENQTPTNKAGSD